MLTQLLPTQSQRLKRKDIEAGEPAKSKGKDDIEESSDMRFTTKVTMCRFRFRYPNINIRLHRRFPRVWSLHVSCISPFTASMHAKHSHVRIIQASSALTLLLHYMFLVSTGRQFFIEEALFFIAFLSTEALCLLNAMPQ